MEILLATSELFEKFGRVIKTNNLENTHFEVKHTESESKGWRIATLEVRNRTLQKLHCHPYSDEFFEPIEGGCILIVSHNEIFKNMRAFFLDRPVCVNREIWHGTIALSELARIRIVENASMSKMEIYIGNLVPSLNN